MSSLPLSRLCSKGGDKIARLLTSIEHEVTATHAAFSTQTLTNPVGSQTRIPSPHGQLSELMSQPILLLVADKQPQIPLCPPLLLLVRIPLLTLPIFARRLHKAMIQGELPC